MKTAALQTFGCVLAGGVLLLAPAMLNGFPLLFFDTMHYYAGGEKLVSLLTDRFAAPALEPTGPIAPPAPEPAPSDPESGRGLMSYMGGRSPYYSGPLYVLAQLSAWAPAFAQALTGAWLVYLASKAFGLSRARYLAIMAGLTLLSVLPWMASYLMPDVFGGYAIVAAGLLLFAPGAFGKWERRALIVALIAFASFHTINLLLLLLAAPLAALILLALKTSRAEIARALTPLLIAAPAALAATLIYPVIAAAALGKPLPQPPFLMARVLADGPGRAYLRQACATEAPYTLCQFKTFALDDGDTILWSLDPAEGVYRASSWEVQQKLIAEQTRFVLGVATHEPLALIGAALTNWRRQIFYFGARDLLTDPAGWRGAAAAGAVDDPLLPFLRSRAGQGALPVELFTHLHTLALAAALAFLLYRLTRPDMRHAETVVALAAFAVALILLNAAIAGALSGVFARYQARVVWIVPLLALLCAARYGLTPRPAAQPAAAART